MEKCLGIRFRTSGKIYYFKPNDEEINVGEACIVETMRGIEFGMCVKKDIDVDENTLKTPLKTIMRKATIDDYIFKGIKLWNMPEMDIETSVMEMWKKTYNTIKSGNIVRYIKNGKRKTNFVGMSENEVCHVRPHGRDSKDVIKLPVADKFKE